MATLDAVLYISAMFSVRKYSDPPMIPSISSSSSSCQLSAHSLLCEMNQMHTYARAKR